MPPFRKPLFARFPLLTVTLYVAGTCCLQLVAGCKSAEDRSAFVPAPATEPSSAQPPGIQVDAMKASSIDDAALVLAQCGRPTSDVVLPIYNKMDNGPVRRMVFRRRRIATVEFVPSHPIARNSLSARGTRLPLTLPAGSVWRFDVVRVPKEVDMITSSRIAYFLPCAAVALKEEY